MDGMGWMKWVKRREGGGGNGGVGMMMMMMMVLGWCGKLQMDWFLRVGGGGLG